EAVGRRGVGPVLTIGLASPSERGRPGGLGLEKAALGGGRGLSPNLPPQIPCEMIVLPLLPPPAAPTTSHRCERQASHLMVLCDLPGPVVDPRGCSHSCGRRCQKGLY